jgi:pimeloyl-ACP methyl ester carboxylesterase
VRSRSEFVKRGITAVFLGAPSDQQNGWGMSDDFRLSVEHFRDMSVVVDDLRKMVPAAPLFLIGTSRGSISAAALAARFGDEIGSRPYRDDVPAGAEKLPATGTGFESIRFRGDPAAAAFRPSRKR